MCFAPHQDFALKHAARLTREHSLAGLPAGTIRRRVIQRRGSIHHRPACRQLGAIHVAGCLRPRQRGMDFHARKPRTGGNRHGVITRISRNACMDHGKMKGAFAFLLRAPMREHRAFRQINLKHWIVQILRAATHRGFQQSQFSTRAKADHVARMESEGAAGINGDGKQFQMPGIHTRRHIQQQAIFEHQRIQRRHGMFGQRRQRAQHAFQCIQMLRDRSRAIGKPAQRRKISAKAPIYKHCPCRATRLWQRQRAGNGRQRLGKTSLRDRRKVRVFPSLHPPCRKTARRHMRRCIVTQRRKPRQARPRQMILETVIAREETCRA